MDNIRYGPFQSATLGYWLGEEFSKKGIMTESLNSVMIYASNNVGISRIEAATLPNNIASRGYWKSVTLNMKGWSILSTNKRKVATPYFICDYI